MTDAQRDAAIAANTTWINSVIANSRLPAELAAQTSITDTNEVSILQKGTDDAKGVDTGLLRGYRGLWNAQTNTPTLIDGTGIELDKFFISVSGAQNLGSGLQSFKVGDRIEFINGVWYKRNGGGIELSLNTGVLTGGVVSPDGDLGVATTFSVSAGTGYILDWTTPSAPTAVEISWPAFTNQSIPNIGTELFTTISVQESTTPLIGELVLGNDLFTPQNRRSLINLQSVVHTDFATITSVATSSKPAYEITEALLDYINTLGPLNDGNQYSENGANLSVDKTSGLTTFPFINRDNDPQNPTGKTNISITLASFTKFYQDGVGGFTIVAGQTTVDPDEWDDGTGVLATVANNKFTIKRFYFFGATGTSAMTYGQAEYSSLGDARSNIFLEAPTVNPVFQRGTFVTALITKKGVTNLTTAIAAGDAEFIGITSETSGGGAGAVGNFITQDTDQLTGNTGNKTLDGDWRFNNNLSLGAASPTFKLEIEDAGGDFIKLNRTSGDIGSWDIQISSALGGGTGTLRFIPSVSTADFHVLSDGGASRFIVDTSTGNVTVSGVYISGGFTVATLPTGITGARAYVTDALTPTYLGTAVGGGVVTVPVFYDGTNWIT